MLALIDADIVAYRVGFASETETAKIAISRAGEFMEELVMKPYVGDYKGFLTGSNNFRNSIAVTKKYKGNRSQPKPVHYEVIREYLVSAWACEVQEEQEADDAIGIEAYSMDVKDTIIMSIDKDLNMIRGHHYNFIKDEKYFVEEDEAIKFFYTQCLTGDRTDNIPGLDRVGPVKAAKILEGKTTEREMYEAVLEAYEGRKEYLCEQARLLWIRRSKDQIWNPPE